MSHITRPARGDDNILFSLELHPCVKFYHNRLMERGLNAVKPE